MAGAAGDRAGGAGAANGADAASAADYEYEDRVQCLSHECDWTKTREKFNGHPVCPKCHFPVDLESLDKKEHREKALSYWRQIYGKMPDRISKPPEPFNIFSSESWDNFGVDDAGGGNLSHEKGDEDNEKLPQETEYEKCLNELQQLKDQMPARVSAISAVQAECENLRIKAERAKQDRQKTH